MKRSSPAYKRQFLHYFEDLIRRGRFSSAMFRLFTLILMCFIWIQPSSSIMSECKNLDMTEEVPNMEKIITCAQKLYSLAEQDKEKNSAVQGKIFLAGMLKEKMAKEILLARKLMFKTVVVENTNWRTLTIGATNVGKKFSLKISGNPLLTDVHFYSDVFANKTIIVRGNGQLSRETIERLKKIDGNNIDIQEYGECSFSSEISDFSYLNGCTSITKNVAFNSLPVGEMKLVPLGRDSCVQIRKSNLTSISFLDLSKATKADKCLSRIGLNPLLCLSPKQKRELMMIWPKIAVEKNDDKCEYECLANEIMNGSLPENKTCYVIRGQLVLDDLKDDSVLLLDFSKVAEIRGGGLRINGATIKDFELFPNLMAIDLEDSQGAAIELTDTEINTFSFPSLLKIEGNVPEGPLIVLKNNINLKMSDNERLKWEALSGGRLEISNSLKTNESTNSSTPATATKDHSNESEFPWMYFSIALGAGVILLLCLILLPVFVYVTFNGSFKLPKIKPLSGQKKELLKDLAEEALKMNPLEWRQMVFDEALQPPKKSTEKTNIRMALRTKYALFLDKILANYPLKFRSPFECKDSEIFSTLKKFYQKTKGWQTRITESDFWLCEDVQDEEGSATTTTIKDTTIKDITTRGTTIKEVEQGGIVFEARAKLLKSKKFNDDIMIYTYAIHLSEGDPGNKKVTKYKLKLVNYHTWSSGPVPKDRTTIIQLCEYNRSNKSMFAATSCGHTFSLLMNKMITDHILCLDYPKVTIDEAKVFLTDLVQMSCTPDDALIFCLMTILDWANREMLISADKTQKYKDFVHIYDKVIKYMSKNPNNIFFDAKDIELNKDVYKRVTESTAYKKISMVSVKEATLDQTISLAGKVEDDSFKKDDSGK